MVLLQTFLNIDTLLYPQEPMAIYYLIKYKYTTTPTSASVLVVDK
jgi:hypothetical protein